VGTVAWVPLQLRAPFPTIDIRLSLARPVVFTNLASAFVAVPVMSNMIVTALQVTAPTTTGYGFGLTTLEAGSIMLPFGLVMVVLSPIAGVLLNRWGGRHVLILGCMVVAIVFSARVFADHSVVNVVISTSAIGAGLSLAFAAIPTLMMEAVPSADSASANGVNNLVRALASCIATAAIALLVSTAAVNVDGQDYLSQGGLHLGFWLSALAAAIAAGFAALVPGGRLRHGQIGVNTQGPTS
jgi:MFS family permease